MSFAPSSFSLEALAGALGTNRAYYYSEDLGLLEKFRPYGLPAAGWLAAVGRQLAGHAGAPVPGESEKV